MIHAYLPEAIRAAEAPLLAAGVPLMRQAALQVANLARRLATCREITIAVFAGGGNNGGDGLWAAVELARRGYRTVIYLDRDNPNVEAIGAAQDAGIVISRDLHRVLATNAEIWIDALAGIGLVGAPRAAMAEVLCTLRAHAERTNPTIIAVDTPSGLGEQPHDGPILPATHTVTMIAPTTAQLCAPGRDLVGTLHVANLQVPIDPQTASAIMVGPRDIATYWPRPRHEDHKYTRGVALVAAGSHTYPGAGMLATAAALAVGPGMVRYQGEVANQIVATLPEVVTAPGRVQAALIGSGIEPGDQLARQVAKLCETSPVVVCDAGALSHLPSQPTNAALVATPHAGELAAMLAITRAQVAADPLSAARTAASRFHATIALKGPHTVIVEPSGMIYTIQTAPPALAAAGSGDVLAGTIVGALAQFQARSQAGEAQVPVGMQVALAASLHAAAAQRAGGYPLQVRQLPQALTRTLHDFTHHETSAK